MRKPTISFVISVFLPSISMEQLDSYWTDFYENHTWAFFDDLSRKFKFALHVRRTGTLHEDMCTFMIMCSELFLKWEISQAKCVEIKYILCLKAFFPRKSCRLSDKVAEHGRGDKPNKVHALWITKPTHTHTHTLRICSTYCFSTTTKVSLTRLSVTLYVLCLSCYNWDGVCLLRGKSSTLNT
jgi:hypothetical protein